MPQAAERAPWQVSLPIFLTLNCDPLTEAVIGFAGVVWNPGMPLALDVVPETGEAFLGKSARHARTVWRAVPILTAVAETARDMRARRCVYPWARGIATAWVRPTSRLSGRRRVARITRRSGTADIATP